MPEVSPRHNGAPDNQPNDNLSYIIFQRPTFALWLHTLSAEDPERTMGGCLS